MPVHQSQLVTTHGAPHRYRISGPAPTTFHIERCRCGKATAPSTSRAVTEGRWTEPTGQHRIPLSHLSRARAAVSTLGHRGTCRLIEVIMRLQPKAQAARKAAYTAQGRTLRRTRGGFAAMPAQV
ncbi:hypothetical protein LLE56_06360 [Xanthomonas campestris]|uniref:hypothetical protein n=1 Tax=Xanthomonas TaxID=338 RepID=UPI0012AA1B6F|nr:hypothetical protein [Xanthomonas campestris]MCC5042754.1 hypothetical protein [Xanthomonas campestris]BBJ96692.1 hypothetical protein Xcc1_24220 [Xanthomonas campestris pv. campestris]